MFIDTCVCFSNGFDKIGSTEMGLKFEGSDLLPDLKRGDNFCFLKYLGEGVLVNTKVIYIYIYTHTHVKVLAIKGAERRSIFPSKPSVPFVFDCFKWHTYLYTSLTVIKGSALALWLIFSVQYCSSTVCSLLRESHLFESLCWQHCKNGCLRHLGKFH